MKRASIPFVVAAALAVAALSVAAAVPQMMSYQGILRDDMGNPVPDGSYSLTFLLYDVDTGGASLWSETQMVGVEDGILNAILGTVTPLALAFDQPYWLGIQVEGSAELEPRVQLTAAPYALRALVADTGDDGDWVIDGDDIYRSSGSVGIGAPPPAPRKGTDEEPRESGSERGANRLFVSGTNQTVARFELTQDHDTGTDRSALAAYRFTLNDHEGTGFGATETLAALKGVNGAGEPYSFGVAGYTPHEDIFSGGVLGSSPDGATWGSLGYRDEDDLSWGLYTQGNAHVGGFTMRTGATAGYVLTADAQGNASWQAGSGGVIGGAGSPGYVPKFTASTTIANSQIYDNGSKVGIGVTNPDARFGVHESTDQPGLEVFSSADAGSGCVVDLRRTADPQTNADVLQLVVPDTAPEDAQFIECEYGFNNPVFSVDTDGGLWMDGRARVYGGAFVGGGLTADITVNDEAGNTIDAEYHSSGDHDGVAVYGSSVVGADDGWGYGGRFTGGYCGAKGAAIGTGSRDNYGLYGQAYGSTSYSYGVYGTASTYGGANCGLLGYAHSGASNIGVYGWAAGGGSMYAGYFYGNVEVTGILSKGAGSFKIDHPLDPANMYLSHSFVESPDMMNVYNGNVVLNARGEAWVELPEWFEVLNRDFRYQLTPIGGPGPNLFVAERVAGNRFRIAGGERGLEVSWQITGIRQDRFAEENRIQVEEPKQPEERGKYLHPELYGRAREEAVRYVETPEELHDDRR